MAMHNRLLETSLIILISLCALHLCVSPGGYGEACNKRKQCNSTADLKCLKGTCVCQNSDAQAYSESRKSCVVKIGRRCGAENDTIAEDNDVPELPCVDNAECKKLKLRKWCRCKEGFAPNGQGSKCLPVAKYGDACNAKEPCDKKSGTECVNGKCLCPFEPQQYYDKEERHCVSYAGANCTTPKVSACVPNAECVNVQLRTGYTSEDGVKKVHTKSVTQCHCKKGFSETKNGHCMGMAGTECSVKQPCLADAFLVCVDGKCNCRNPLHEVVDNRTSQCVSLVGSACHDSPISSSTGGGVMTGIGALKKGSPDCVQNAECVKGKCVCKEGFSPTPRKSCLLGYKQSCEPFQCNRHAGLACINGECECFDSNLVLDTETNACIGISSTQESGDGVTEADVHS